MSNFFEVSTDEHYSILQTLDNLIVCKILMDAGYDVDKLNFTSSGYGDTLLYSTFDLLFGKENVREDNGGPRIKLDLDEEDVKAIQHYLSGVEFCCNITFDGPFVSVDEEGILFDFYSGGGFINGMVENLLELKQFLHSKHLLGGYVNGSTQAAAYCA